MSEYTTQLRYICEERAGLTQSVGDNDTENVIETARLKIFNFDYEMYDTAHKPEFERKFLNRYYFREIAYETYGQWHFKLRELLRRVMPQFNELYKTVDFEYNPINDVDVTYRHETVRDDARNRKGNGTTKTDVTRDTAEKATETGGRTGHGDSSLTGSNHNRSVDLYSDTPQGGIDIFGDGTGENTVGNNDYLTNARIIDNNGGETNATTTHETETNNRNNQVNRSELESHDKTEENNVNEIGTMKEVYTETIKGKRGTDSYGIMIQRYREQIINVDEMLLDRLEELFLCIW